MTAPDLWAALAAPIPRAELQFRLDGKPTVQNGKWRARAVCYADVPTVVRRLDSVAAGQWEYRGKLLRGAATAGGENVCAVRGRLTVCGVTREDVGQGDDPKSANTDAIKRAARLFGVALELWEMGPVWVEVDGDSKYARIVGDPWAEYDAQQRREANGATVDAYRADAERRMAERDAAAARGIETNGTPAGSTRHDISPEGVSFTHADPPCPKCNGKMWDNRVGKRNPKAPDFKCRDKACDGVIWPEKGAKPGKQPVTIGGDDEIPF